MSALRDTSVSKLSYLTHALQDSTAPKELDMIHSPALWALLGTGQVWPMRVSAHNVLVAFTVRRLVVTTSLAHVREVFTVHLVLMSVPLINISLVWEASVQ